MTDNTAQIMIKYQVTGVNRLCSSIILLIPMLATENPDSDSRVDTRYVMQSIGIKSANWGFYDPKVSEYHKYLVVCDYAGSFEEVVRDSEERAEQISSKIREGLDTFTQLAVPADRIYIVG